MSKMFDNLWTAEDRKTLADIEETCWKSNCAMKGLSLFFLIHVRFFRRPAGRPWIFEPLLLYFFVYTNLACNIPGTILTASRLEPLVLKVSTSKKVKKAKELDVYLDETNLSDFRAALYDKEM